MSFEFCPTFKTLKFPFRIMLILSALLIYSFSSIQLQTVTILPLDQLSSEVETVKELLADGSFDESHSISDGSDNAVLPLNISTASSVSLSHRTSGPNARKIPYHLLDLPPPADA